MHSGGSDLDEFAFDMLDDAEFERKALDALLLVEGRKDCILETASSPDEYAFMDLDDVAMNQVNAAESQYFLQVSNETLKTTPPIRNVNEVHAQATGMAHSSPRIDDLSRNLSENGSDTTVHYP